MADHDDAHDHGPPNVHGHDHSHHHDEHEPAPDLSAWVRGAQTATCPACDAPGALTLGGGLFCPTCGEVSTNPGYQAAPAAEPEPDQ